MPGLPDRRVHLHGLRGGAVGLVHVVTDPGPLDPPFGERCTFERPVMVKVGRGRPYVIGVVRGETWPDVSRAFAVLLRSTADKIDQHLTQGDEQPG